MSSIFAKVENAEHTAVAWIEKELTTRSRPRSPADRKRVIDAGLTYVGPALESLD